MLNQSGGGQVAKTAADQATDRAATGTPSNGKLVHIRIFATTAANDVCRYISPRSDTAMAVIKYRGSAISATQQWLRNGSTREKLPLLLFLWFLCEWCTDAALLQRRAASLVTSPTCGNGLMRKPDGSAYLIFQATEGAQSHRGSFNRKPPLTQYDSAPI